MPAPHDDNVFVDDLPLDDLIATALARPPSETEQRAKIVALFASDQPPMGRLVRWGSQIAIERGPSVLDVARASCARITVPGLDEVQTVGGDTVRFAGGLRGQRVTVLRERGARWEPLPLPEALDDPAIGRVALTAGGESLIVRGYPHHPHSARDLPRAQWWTGERWIALNAWAPLRMVSPERVLLAYANGEWGGGVHCMLPDGLMKEVEPRDGQPVQAIAPLPGGRALVGTGLAHMGSLTAHVGVLALDGTWRPLVRSSKDRIAWNLPADVLVGLDVDAQGRPHLLLGSHGIVRLDGDQLTLLTPGWPPAVTLYAACLLLDGDVAVIATPGRGLLRWKLGTSEVCRFSPPGIIG